MWECNCVVLLNICSVILEETFESLCLQSWLLFSFWKQMVYSNTENLCLHSRLSSVTEIYESFTDIDICNHDDCFHFDAAPTLQSRNRVMQLCMIWKYGAGKYLKRYICLHKVINEHAKQNHELTISKPTKGWSCYILKLSGTCRLLLPLCWWNPQLMA